MSREKQQNFVRSPSGAMIPIPGPTPGATPGPTPGPTPGAQPKTPTPKAARRKRKPGQGAGRR